MFHTCVILQAKKLRFRVSHVIACIRFTIWSHQSTPVNTTTNATMWCTHMSTIKRGSKVQYWQLIDIPRPISSYCFYKDICPSPNLYPDLLQLPILHLYEEGLAHTCPISILQKERLMFTVVALALYVSCSKPIP